MGLVNKRQNPIDSSTSPVTITDEAHTVAEFTELPGVYGFYLEERPVSGTVSVREDNTAETPFTIVNAAPSPGQVFIDYNSNRGMLLFNVADDATAIIVTYNGIGTNQTVENTKKIALETPLSDYVVGSNTAIANTDTLYEALGKVQGQINSSSADVATQIHAASGKTTPVYADELGLADSAASFGLKKLTFANLFLWIISKIAALATKTTPVDADGILLIDSAASNVGKFLSWANLRATLTSYFDTFYPTMNYTAPAAVTPTFNGLGTVTSITAYTWRIGALLFFEVRGTAGTTTAAEMRIGLRHNPGTGEVSVTTASTYPTLQVVGNLQSGTNTANYPVLAEASQTYVTVGVQSVGASAGLGKKLGSELTSSSVFSASGCVRIQGW